MSRTDRTPDSAVGGSAGSIEEQLLGHAELCPSAEHPSVLVAAADVYASLARAASRARAPLRCDACDELLEGEVGGRGLLVWARGGELRIEEPPLCERCASAIGSTMLRAYEDDGDDEG